MPLQEGSSQETISHNISEMVHAGHPQKQAVAAALRKSREDQVTHKAAGILFRAKSGNVLLLRRSETALDCPGCWDFPGGGREGDETASECALREAVEEVGKIPKGDLKFHTRTCSAPQGVAGVGAVGNGIPVPPTAPVAANMPPDVDYTSFVMAVDDEFLPSLSREHDGWAWAPVEAPPQPLHPGVQVALDRFGMDEVGVARAIAEGRLSSPQRYENVMLWAIRVTGTGGAYRSKHNEFVIRQAEDHLTSEALARLNGLPVIFKHPPTQLLNSEEFANRVVGTIFLPYVSGTEAWGIAKIFDDDANRAMLERDLSTSPGVNFEDFSVNAKITLEDGSKVLVEGKPSLFDHVAICELGVWDKDGEPAGIRSESREDSAMASEAEKAKDDAKRDDKAKDDAHRDDAKRDDHKMDAKADASKKDEFPPKDKDEEKSKDDAKRDDADAGTTLEKTLGFIADSMKSMHKRMDALEDREKERDDAAKKRDDAKADAKKDDEPDKDEKGKELAAADKAKDDKQHHSKRDDKAKDDARADAATLSMDQVKELIDKAKAEVKMAIPKDANDDDYHAVHDAQAAMENTFVALGMRAPRPLQAETKQIYNRRCARMLQPFSPTWKGKDLDATFRNDEAFDVVLGQIKGEAYATGMNPSSVEGGQLRMIEKRVDGHTHRTFVGDPRSWMDPFAGGVQLKAVGSFKDGRGARN